MLLKVRPKKKFYSYGSPAAFYKAGAAGLGLQTSLSAFWSLENTSWLDDTGNGNTLTPANTPTITTGAVGNGVNLVAASSQSLTRANNTGLQTGAGNFSISLWANMVGASAASYLSKNDGGFGEREWAVGDNFFASNNYAFNLYSGGATSHFLDSGVIVSAGFKHLVCTWDGTTMKMYVNAGTAATLVPGITGSNGLSNVFIGKDGEGGGFCNGVIDQVGIWKGRVLSAADVTALYNSGAGLTFAAMA